MSMSWQGLTMLHVNEPVLLETGVFQNMVLMGGAANGLPVADDLFEDFVVCLSSVETAWMAGEFQRLTSQAEMLASLSETLGMVQTAQVARQLADLVERRDDVALAAVVARTVRLGEASLASVLEYAYRQI